MLTWQQRGPGGPAAGGAAWGRTSSWSSASCRGAASGRRTSTAAGPSRAASADCRGHEPAVVPAAGGRGLCPTGIRTFIDALEKVARLNGISRDRPGWLQSWQHSTIARRVEFLQQHAGRPGAWSRASSAAWPGQVGAAAGARWCFWACCSRCPARTWKAARQRAPDHGSWKRIDRRGEYLTMQVDSGRSYFSMADFNRSR